jgi:zinc protease
MTSIKFAAVILFCSTCATGGAGYNGLSPKDPIPLMENLRQGTLDNGLRYYIYENRMPEERATLTLAVNAGAVLEDDDENGLAHFVEHMAFNGTERFSGSEVVDYLRSLGMRFGPEVNAYTSRDETVYGIDVPVETDAAGIKRIPEKAFNILDDWTHAITFAPDSVDNERRVIMEEYRLRRMGASGRQNVVLLAGLLAGSRYAERDVIGLPEIIENAPAERIKGFYQKWYKPENMAVIFTGDFDGAALEESLTGYFNAPAGGASPVRPEYSLPPPEKGNINIDIFTDPELSYTSIMFSYKQKYVKKENTIAEYREDLIDNLISRMLNERFNDDALNPDAPYVAGGAGEFSIVRPSLFYELVFVSKPGMVEASLDDLLVMKESMRRYGFSAAEINRAKHDLLSVLRQAAAEKEKTDTAVVTSELTEHFLSGAPAPDAEWKLATAERLLPNISRNDVHKVARGYFADDDVFVFIAAPEAEAPVIPSKDIIEQKVKSAGRLRIARPVEAAFDSELLDEAPVRGQIIEETTDEKTGIVEWKLSNGASVLLQNTVNKNDDIELYAASRGGTAAAPLEDAISAELAAELLSASGVGPWPRSELVKKLAGKQVSVSFSTSNFSRNIRGASNTKDAKTLFELLYLHFTDVRIDPQAVKVVTDEYRTILAQRSQNPESVFSDEIQRVTYGENPRFMPMTLDDLPKINAAGALAFLEKCFNPADYAFAITGNIDFDAMRDFVETYIASIPAKDEFNKWEALTPPIQRPGKTDLVIRKGKEDRGFVYSGRFIPRTFDENTSLVCSLLSSYLDIVLVESIREKLGGAYSIGASVSLSPTPLNGELRFSVRFACDPKRAEELNQAVEAELAKIAAGNINADTLDNARKSLVKSWETYMQSNYFLSSTFANYRALFDIPLDHLYERPSAYEALRQSDMQNLMRDILRQGAATVILYPEN